MNHWHSFATTARIWTNWQQK